MICFLGMNQCLSFYDNRFMAKSYLVVYGLDYTGKRCL